LNLETAIYNLFVHIHANGTQVPTSRA